MQALTARHGYGFPKGLPYEFMDKAIPHFTPATLCNNQPRAFGLFERIQHCVRPRILEFFEQMKVERSPY